MFSSTHNSSNSAAGGSGPRLHARLALVAGLALSLVGCAGDGFEASASALEYRSYADLGDAAALELIDTDVWQAAPAGCEGLLSSVSTYGIASGEPELIVGLRGASVICVDTYASVERELDETAPMDVDGLWLGYIAALQNLEGSTEEDSEMEAEGSTAPMLDVDLGFDISISLGDPSPQPSIIGVERVLGDPSPQPSDGDPSPQPSNADAE
ncbi:MAG: hypothetical protein AAF938_25980 [Myxococcota bacterium]